MKSFWRKAEERRGRRQGEQGGVVWILSYDVILNQFKMNQNNVKSSCRCFLTPLSQNEVTSSSCT
jgi:hypothetical protein